MQKLKKGIINSLAKVLATVDTSKMSSDSRIAIVRNFIATKLVAKEVEEAKKQAAEKLITEDFKELQNKNDKTDDEKVKLAELEQSINVEFSEIINPILEEDAEIDIKKISEEDFDKVIEGTSNMNLAQLDLLHELIVE